MRVQSLFSYILYFIIERGVLSNKEPPDKILNELKNGINDGDNMFIEEVSKCANIELDQDSCLMSTTFDMMMVESTDDFEELIPFLRQLEESNQYSKNGADQIMDNGLLPQCLPPDMDEDTIRQLVYQAQETCLRNRFTVERGEVNNAVSTISNLFDAKSCWMDICSKTRNDITGDLKVLDFTMIERCIDVKFPVTLTNPKAPILSPENSFDDQMLACMIKYVMTMPPSTFGMENYPHNFVDSCFLHGHLNMESVCPIHLGPKALSHCVDQQKDFESNDMSYDYKESLSFSFDYDSSFSFPFSFSSSLSYSYSYPLSHTFGDFLTEEWGNKHNFNKNKPTINDDKTNNNSGKEQAYISEMCSILEKMSSEKGKQCILIACDNNNDGIFSIAPSTVPPITSFLPSSMPDTFSTVLSSSLSTSLSFSTTHSTSLSFRTNEPTHYSSDMTGPPMSSVSEQTSPTLQPTGLSLKPSVYQSRAVDDDTGVSLTLQPTKTSILEPSISPTLRPSSIDFFPSLQPVARKNGTVEIKFEAGITLNSINLTDIPKTGPELDKIVNILQKIISKALPLGAKTRIIRIGGVLISRRILRQMSELGIEVDFEITMTKTCASSECAQGVSLANTMYNTTTSKLQDAVSSGTLTTAIIAEASNKGVTILKSIAVDSSSFVAEEMVVKVEQANQSDDETDDDDDDSEGFYKRTSKRLVIILLVQFFLMLL